MTSEEFIELFILIAKLRKATRKAATEDKIFEKYHQPSITYLERIPEHLISLEQGLSITLSSQQEASNETKELYQNIRNSRSSLTKS